MMRSYGRCATGHPHAARGPGKSCLVPCGPSHWVEVHWHRSHARSLAPRSRRCSSESMDRPNCLNMQRAGKPALHGVGRAWRGAARRGALPIVRGTAPRQGAVPPERDARARSPARQVEHAPAAPAGDRSVRRWPVSCSRVVCKSAPITSRFIIAPTPAVPIKTQKQKNRANRQHKSRSHRIRRESYASGKRFAVLSDADPNARGNMLEFGWPYG